VTLELVAGTYGVMMSLAPGLQARRMLQRRLSADASVPYLVVLVVGFVIYLVYGISIGNRVLIVTNSVSVVVTGLTLVVALVHRDGQRGDRRAVPSTGQ
jgi:MtN3 and saliva related transmembrane protein